ncbi:MAG: sigma-54 dependent transcriptional regulator [Sinimarinibacterium sp.]|jgi:NtrC-family two-component system response regulator AlgB
MPSDSAAGRVLLIDDDMAVLRAFRRALEDAGHQVVVAHTGAEADAAVQRSVFDVCALDVHLGEESGLDLLPQLREAAPWMRVVMVTAANDAAAAIAAIRAGAADYLTKPCPPEELLHAVGQQLATRRLEQRVRSLEGEHDDVIGYEPADTASPAMRLALELARRVADTEATLLMLGENGTGKTVLARAIHRWSRRCEAVFAPVSCPSLSAELLASELFGHVRGAFTGATDNRQGRVQVAEGGTLFLDEVGDLPLALQPKLLRFLQDQEYERVGEPHTRTADVRLIAATNRNLGEMIAQGKFREDLYYRLNIVSITLPALRDRREDILPIAEHLLLRMARRYDRPARAFSADAVALLNAHSWPGNLRELHNAVERAVIVSDTDAIRPEHLPFGRERPPPASGLRAGDAVSLQALERAHIEAIVSTSPSLEAAARILKIDSSTLYRKRRGYATQEGAQPHTE